MTVAVVVPFRPDGAERDRHWQWLAERWRTAHPGWDLRVGEHPASAGPWCKADAVTRALEDCTADILVVADADVWAAPTDTVTRAAALAVGGAPWVMPHRQVRRLTASASARVLAGEALEVVGAARQALAERPYPGMRGGGLFAIRREAFEDMGGFDPRFRGWGGEDAAFGRAADTLLGEVVRLPGVLWHLWHPPQERISRTIGSEQSYQLAGRYRAARRDRRAMRTLIEERAR